VKTTLLLVLISAFAYGQGSSLDTKQRVKTVHDLGKSAGPDAVSRIAPFVKDPDVSVRIEAVKALDSIGGPQTVDPLLVAAKDSDAEIQIRAEDGLINVYLPGYIKSGMSGSISRVGTSIKAKFSDTNDKIIDAYVMVRPDVIAALGNLAKNGATVESRANAARAIGILRGRTAIPDLIDALRSKDTPVLYEALIALQKIRDPASGPKMAFVTHDLDDRIQIAALETTGILANKDTEPDVRSALDHARDNKVRRAALEALGMLATPPDRDTFLRYLND
jgi:HEAT repeat protein